MPECRERVCFWLSLVALLFLVAPTSAGHTTCASGQLDWYTSVVGETPCMTYQRLRQICNNDYQVPTFRSTTPGDNCDDQVSACCCNTVAFQLSMLCMNCQEDKLSGNQAGFDAVPGTYTRYRGTCGAGTNHSLTSDIQRSVCNEHIRLDDFLYGGWADGSWFYVWMKENAERTHAANNNNTFTHCADQISPAATRPSTTTTITSTATTTSISTPPTTSPATTLSNPADTTTSPPLGPTSSNTLATPSLNTTPGVPDAQSDASLATPESFTTTSSTLSAPTASSTDDARNGQTSSSSHLPVIIGGAVGGVVAVAGIVALLAWLWRCQARRRSEATLKLMESPPDDDFPRRDMLTVRFGTGYGGQRTSAWLDGLAPPSDVARAGYTLDDYSRASAFWRSTVPSDQSLSARHTDAGVVIPLSRSGSGRLPPAYRSWENGSNVGSEGSEYASNSGGGNTTGEESEAETSPRFPLIPQRPEEKHLGPMS